MRSLTKCEWEVERRGRSHISWSDGCCPGCHCNKYTTGYVSHLLHYLWGGNLFELRRRGPRHLENVAGAAVSKILNSESSFVVALFKWYLINCRMPYWLGDGALEGRGRKSRGRSPRLTVARLSRYVVFQLVVCWWLTTLWEIVLGDMRIKWQYMLTDNSSSVTQHIILFDFPLLIFLVNFSLSKWKF